MLAAFVLSFLAIRTSARLTRSVSWWPGGVETGGVHIHHLVWGICLMMFSGFLAFAAPLEAPWWHFVAIGFGVGAGLTMDEFALWVRLQDVYWATEGRASFDAVVIAAAFAGLVVLGTQPFGLDDPASISGTAVAVALILGLAVICFVKGRVLLGVVGLFVPVVALVGAMRLANPSSPWARRRYSRPRLERANARFSPTRHATRWQRRMGDLIAGAPNAKPAPVVGTPPPATTTPALRRARSGRENRRQPACPTSALEHVSQRLVADLQQREQPASQRRRLVGVAAVEQARRGADRLAERLVVGLPPEVGVSATAPRRPA